MFACHLNQLPLRPFLRVQCLELIDTHGPIWDTSDDFQLSAHRLDVASERAQVHIGAAFKLGYGCLLDVQLLCHRYLRLLTCFTQLTQRRFLGDRSDPPRDAVISRRAAAGDLMSSAAASNCKSARSRSVSKSRSFRALCCARPALIAS